MTKKKRLGVIQTRGLGDIVISLPIAHYYHNQGWEICWPIVDEWVEQMARAAPWVHWVPVKADTGAFFYDVPYQRLTELGCEEIIPLYQALTGHPEFTREPWFQHVSFDRYKYIKAGVPFLHKWRLSECITRNHKREKDLYAQLVPGVGEPYVLVHLEGSNHKTEFDPALIPEGWAVVHAPNTGSIWDSLLLMEEAEAVIMVDSCYSNIVDQMNIDVDRYFIPRSHIHLTPVHGNDWTWLDNPKLDPRVKIFSAG